MTPDRLDYLEREARAGALGAPSVVLELVGRVRELEAALRPFAEFGRLHPWQNVPDWPVDCSSRVGLPTMGDCYRAAAVLAGPPPPVPVPPDEAEQVGFEAWQDSGEPVG